VGILVGTYSSVAVAAPLVWSRKHDTVPSGASPAQARGGALPAGS
jgi:preprotein translocase subunit SecF